MNFLQEMSSKTPAKRPFKETSPPPKRTDRVRDDAYKIGIKIVNDKEVNYSYIPISFFFLNVIEKKHLGLKPDEVAKFYTEYHSYVPYLPKAYDYYQAILAETGSVEFTPIERAGHEWAFSQFIIKRVVTSEEWEDSLFKQRELSCAKPRFYSYFDYIYAWSGALFYENRQKKFSWFMQFQLEKDDWEFPAWFHEWFFNWGLFPIILPNKVRNVYELFTAENREVKDPRMMFAILYKLP